jgi:conjugative transposon TraK protein
MFSRAKNIDIAFQHIRLFSLVFLLGCLLISCLVIIKSRNEVANARQQIYILANGKILEAYVGLRKDNIPVEARDHVAMFHYYFFTLDPDEKAINYNIGKALYLADGSAKKQYDNLKESAYYRDIIAGNISQEIKVDTIELNTAVYPYWFRCRAREKLTRSTSILTKRLITEGFLRSVERSDNNSHGFLIERWTIVEEKDLKTESR